MTENNNGSPKYDSNETTENVVESADKKNAVDVIKNLTKKFLSKSADVLDSIWDYFSKENRIKRAKTRKEKPIQIVVYKPKSQFRKLLTIVSWLVFIFLLAFVFYKGYIFTNSLVMHSESFDVESAIGEIEDINKKEINIPSGATTKNIATILLEEGIITNDKYFWIYSLLMGNEGNYKSGKHYIDASVTYDTGNIDNDTIEGYEMLIHILSQDSVPNPSETIFFPEGLNMAQTIALFTEKNIGSTQDFYDISDYYEFDYDFLEQIPNNPRRTSRLEGYLFPDTYIFDVTSEEHVIYKKMLDNFDAKFSDEYKEKAELMGYTIDEIITIASMLEKEADTLNERAMIAGVIYNRLNSSEGYLNYLQIDATIQYLYINETGHVKEFLTYDDHEIMNNYNTYMYAGLPPGPICNPSLSSIAAALYPEHHSYYYYVAKNDGTDAHAYASTLEQHNRNIAQYQNQN